MFKWKEKKIFFKFKNVINLTNILCTSQIILFGLNSVGLLTFVPSLKPYFEQILHWGLFIYCYFYTQ